MTSTSPAATETWDAARRQPSASLRSYVASYTGYRQVGAAPGRHRGLPSPYVTFIVTLDDPLIVAAPSNPREAPDVYQALIGGLHTTPTVISHLGRQSGIQLALEPLGVRALLGLPPSEVANLDVHAVDILGPLADELHERIHLATDWSQRFAILESILLRRVDRDCHTPDDVTGAWELLTRSRGQLSMADLSVELGWSSRYLARRLQAEIGIPPKVAARLMRFDRARRMLQSRITAGQTPRLAELAVECGYYDQAHLSGEFSEMAGCSPGRWVAEEFRNFQAFADDPAADCSA